MLQTIGKSQILGQKLLWTVAGKKMNHGPQILLYQCQKFLDIRSTQKAIFSNKKA